MNVRDAAAQTLEEAGQPLHYREITRLLLENGLWQSNGHTPEATVNARIVTDIATLGANSRFQRTGKGVFALRMWGLTGPQPPVSRKDSPPRPDDNDELAKSLSFTDAAEEVLDRFAAKKPMHYRAITDKALELGLIATSGLTPEATMYAQVLTEIKRQTQRGEEPRFVKQGKGFLGLSRWIGRGLALQIDQQNNAVRKKLHEYIQKMPAKDFENLIGRLLGAIGFEQVEVTTYSGDGGIDVRGILVVGDVIRTRVAVQVKRWKHNIQAPAVQQVRGSLGTHEQGLIITTSDFSAGAREEAQRRDAVPVALMNGQQLVALLVENELLYFSLTWGAQPQTEQPPARGVLPGIRMVTPKLRQAPTAATPLSALPRSPCGSRTCGNLGTPAS